MVTHKIAKAYRLCCDDPETDGRPCWLQKVARAQDLFIIAQARKPSENGFPYVESMLVSISSDGHLVEYGGGETLGVVTLVETPEGRSRQVIDWLDGTGVRWVEYP